MNKIWMLIFALGLPLAANAKVHSSKHRLSSRRTAAAAVEKHCYTLSEKKRFRTDDPRLPLLCITKDQRISKNPATRFITVKKHIGHAGVGTSDYVAQVKYAPSCKSCNKRSFKLLNVNYDSPYLVFNGHNQGGGERGYLVFRGEGYYYRATSQL